MSRLPFHHLSSLLLAASLFSLAVPLSACRKRAPPTDELSRFALGVVDAARSPGGLRAEQVDDELVERVRRLQLVWRTTMDTWDQGKLLEAFHGEAGPDRQYAPSERAQKQRERASRGIQSALEGTCKAASWDEGKKQRVAVFMRKPAGTFPEEVLSGQRDLALRLEKAQMARVTCQRGEIGLLLVEDASGHRRLVDVISLTRTNIERNPNDPLMK